VITKHLPRAMKMSESMELVWNLAGREAIAAEFGSIEPEHFFEALLKFAELAPEDTRKIASNAEMAGELNRHVGSVRQEFERRKIDPRRLRRKLRAKLGNGRTPYNDGPMHRSEASRGMFEVSSTMAKAAKSERLTPNFLLQALLESPTQVMKALLGEGPSNDRPAATAWLDKMGLDLIQMAAAGQLPMEVANDAECRALMSLLEAEDRKSVWLVTENPAAARSVVAAVAQALHAGKAGPGLKFRRLISLETLKLAGQGADEAARRFGVLVEEAGRAGNVVLLLPALEPGPDGSPASAWIETIGATLGKPGVQWISSVCSQIFNQFLRKDLRWKRHTQAMWLGETRMTSIPGEL
jgi:ATP-dependent Clp protease ATP-binding subunit ClpA